MPASESPECNAADVYAKNGSLNWIADLAFIIFGAIGFGLWAWRVAYRTARRRARRDDFLIPQSY